MNVLQVNKLVLHCIPELSASKIAVISSENAPRRFRKNSCRVFRNNRLAATVGMGDNQLRESEEFIRF